MLEKTKCIYKVYILPNKRILLDFNKVVKYIGACYNEQCYNERMLQRTVFINKIRMLQRMQRNIIYYGKFDDSLH